MASGRRSSVIAVFVETGVNGTDAHLRAESFGNLVNQQRYAIDMKKIKNLSIRRLVY